MKTRPAMSMLTLEEALEQTREVSSWAELEAYVRDRFDFWAPIRKITSSSWGEEVDPRCGWKTWLVLADGRIEQNLAYQIQYLLEALAMIAQADTLAEARGIAEDTIAGYQAAIKAARSAH